MTDFYPSIHQKSLYRKENVPYGTTPEYDGPIPTKDEDEHYTYVFDGWSVKSITGDTTVEPVFKAVGKPFSITFSLSGGTWKDGTTGDLVITEPYGTKIPVPEPGIRPGFTFEYWEGSRYYPGDLITVKENHSLKAIWEPKKTTGTESSQTTDNSNNSNNVNNSNTVNTNNNSNNSSNNSGNNRTPDKVISCQVAGYPSNYVWNETTKSCEAGYLDAGGNFHGYGTNLRNDVPNTYDSNRNSFWLFTALSSITTAFVCYKLLRGE